MSGFGGIELHWRFGLAGALLLFASPAFGDIGKAPAGPGEFYLGLGGGYRYVHGPETTPYDFTDMGPIVGGIPPGVFEPQTFDHAEGYFVDLTLGFNAVQPIFGAFDRVELFGAYADAELVKEVVPGPTETVALGINFGGLPTTLTVNNPAFVIARQEFTSVELGLRFKRDLLPDPDGMQNQITISFEPFVRYESYDTKLDAIDPPAQTPDATRTTDAESWYYGAQMALEGEVPVTQDTALVARVAAGIYGAHTSADFDYDLIFFGGQQGGDTKSFFGGRFGGAAGIKHKLGPLVTLSLTGSVDYWTDVAKINFTPPTNPTTPTTVGTDDMIDVRIGAGVTINLGAGP